MKVARSGAELRAALGGADRIGFVPTMGYLHDGHLSLFDLAGSETDTVVASIYVNPLQFGPDEDLDTYPRDLEGDLEKAEERGVDLVFLPTTEEMYPDGEPLVTVAPGPMADRLCGAHREGHFRGVLTVVAKLFNLVEPDVAFFGRKDYQQGVLIRRMVRDLHLPIEVHLAPIVREDDGLALSSRNAYLSPEERRQALGLSRAIEAARDAYRGGETDAIRLLGAARSTLKEFPGLEPQYVELVHPETLESVDRAEDRSVLALAAHCGGTRLIDNGELDGTL